MYSLSVDVVKIITKPAMYDKECRFKIKTQYKEFPELNVIAKNDCADFCMRRKLNELVQISGTILNNTIELYDNKSLANYIRYHGQIFKDKMFIDISASSRHHSTFQYPI